MNSNTNAVNECVRYIICREGSKIPINRSDINDHLVKNLGVDRNKTKTIISEASAVLENVYGYKLVSVDTKPPKYIVILDKKSNSMLSTYNDPQYRKVLVAALIHIYMTGAPVAEDELWQFLTQSQLMKEDDVEIKKVVKRNFIRQLYLKYTKIQEDSGTFEWGERAELEIPKLFILEIMAEAFNTEPQYWTQQYNDATKLGPTHDNK